jgi:glycosyltransferase involved in cell wall biosynthesis
LKPYQSEVKSKIFLPGYTAALLFLYKTLDVYVNCSLTEGMPISILEAMRSGCQIVATKIPANMALLGHINNLGQLCELNTDSLAQSIIRLYRTNSDLKIKQKAVYRANLPLITLCKMARCYQKIYDEYNNTTLNNMHGSLGKCR